MSLHYIDDHNIVSLHQKNGNYQSSRGWDFSDRLSRIRNDLSYWNSYHLGSLEKSLDLTLEQVSALQTIEAQCMLFADEKNLLSSCLNKSKTLSRQLNIKQRTLAKCRWLKTGGYNTIVSSLGLSSCEDESHSKTFSQTIVTMSLCNLLINCFACFYANMWGSPSVSPIDPIEFTHLASPPFFSPLIEYMSKSLSSFFSQ